MSNAVSSPENVARPGSHATPISSSGDVFPSSGGQPDGRETSAGGPGWSSRVYGLDRWLVHRLLTCLGRPAVAVVLWDGTRICLSAEKEIVTVVIRDRATLLKLLWQPSIGFAEGYRSGAVDVQGHLPALCRAVAHTNGSMTGRSWHGLRGIGQRRSCSVQQASDNIHRHYDLGNSFYRLWLDEQLVYTCAYFPSPSVSLEAAQEYKLDLVCQKLHLQPGDEVVEAGCGWGALALHMAKHYDARVRAYNISHEQLEYARDRARLEGVADRVTFIKDDWRNISGKCDRFASVGMLEHVGPENYGEFGDLIHRVLRPSGLALIHTIGRNVACRLDGWIQRDIFPGAEPPSLRQMMDILEPHEFSVLDVENLRQHYTLTLQHWLTRFETHVDQIRDMFDEEFVRSWRLYLTGSMCAFECSGLQLFQVLFTHGRNNAIPWTRHCDNSARVPTS